MNSLAGSILHLTSRDFFILVAAAAMGSLAGFYLIFRWMNRLRLVVDTPTATVRSAPQGFVELEGTARLMEGDPVEAPLSGQRCVWYRFAVERRASGRDEWSVVDQGVSGAIFHLIDGTGACIVDPDGALVLPSVKLRWRGNHRRPGALPLDQGFWGRMFATGEYRYTEERIREGDHLYAIGEFVSLGSADPATPHDEIRDLLVRWKRDPAELRRRFDIDGDRSISLEEWERARREAEREVMASWHERVAPGEAPLLRKPRGGRPFLLSTVAQRDLVRRLRAKVLLAIGMFLGLGALGVFLVNLRAGG